MALITLLHGPNLNLLGQREPHIYGTATLDDYVAFTTAAAREFGHEVDAFQTNHEGQLVDAIHTARGRSAAIIINPGAFTHYAWSIHDALAAFSGPIVEVHISNPNCPRTVAAHQRHRAGVDRVDHGLRHAGIPSRGRGRRGQAERLVMPPLEVAGRCARVRARFDQAEALLISDLTNVRWLTGFTGSNGWALLTPDDIVLVTDGRYGDQAAAQLALAGVEARVLVGLSGARDPRPARCRGCSVRLGRVRGRARHLRAVPALPRAVRDRRSFPSVPSSKPSAGTRTAARSPVWPRPAGSPTWPSPRCSPTAGCVGRTEAEVRNHLEIRMRELGASGPSYETIVATGPVNAAHPHHRPTDTLIEPGHTVIIDVGALYDGYHSDMTRTFFVGEPTQQQRELYEVVLSAQRAGVAAVEAGISTSELDSVCRDAITDAGYGEWFSHGTGSRGRSGDPRRPVHQPHRRPEIAGRRRSDRRAWGLS